MANLNPSELIIRKRDGGRLDNDEIADLIHGYLRGNVADYQMSAFLMAGFLQGFDTDETFALTHAMLHSGVVVDLSDIGGTKVDKHSTGGVGDKISLVLAPLVAACGVPVPMISGRGLGHTGGTLDKLEAIPGFNVNLSIDEYRRLLGDIGIAMIGQTDEIAPADRSLYALRDVTATVECIPYVASSIMSKKLAEGIDALVLDVKCGRGAFMKTEADARRLAETLVEIGERFEKQTTALLTRMDAPLGYAVGNWPETREAIQCLHGDTIPDVTELTLALAAEMIVLGERAASIEEARQLAADALASGSALDKFVQLVDAQGGDSTVIHEPESMPGFSPAAELIAGESTSGYIDGIDGYMVGRVAVALGAGRLRKEDSVDPLAGIVFDKRLGDSVSPGDRIATLYSSRTDGVDQLLDRLSKAVSVSAERPAPHPIVIDRYSERTWTSDAG